MSQDIDYLEFTSRLDGYRVFTQSVYRGQMRKTERFKYALYWGGVTPEEIFRNSKYIIENR